MKILKDIFTSFNWWDLVPDQWLFASQAIAGTTRNTISRSISGDWILAYLSCPTTVSINLSKITTGNGVAALWIDPKTGETTSIGHYRNAGMPFFTTPAGWEDALLWLAGNI
jgi:hypothetical protein